MKIVRKMVVPALLLIPLLVVIGCDGGANSENLPEAEGATNPVEVMVSAVPEPVASAPLRGTTWILETLEGEVIETDVEGKPIDLLFDSQEMRLSGFSGCNRYMGSFELAGGALLSLGPLAGTRMACADDSGLEYRYLQVLGSITAYQRANGGLSLTRQDLVVATFRPG
jgi:heat shock protein HslJ